MNEDLIFETMESALSGAQHAEEITAGLVSDLQKVERDGKELNSEIFRDGLFTISAALDAVETLLFQSIQVRKIDEDHKARLNEIEEAARRIDCIERPEMPSEELFANIPDGLDEDLPFQDEEPPWIDYDGPFLSEETSERPRESFPSFPRERPGEIATIAIENTTTNDTMIVCMHRNEGALISPGDFLEIHAPAWGTVWTAGTHEERRETEGIHGHFKVLDRRPEWLPEDALEKASFIRAENVSRSPLPY